MSSIEGQFGCLDASFLQYGGLYEWGQPLQNMMIDYSIHKGNFLNFIAPNIFFKLRLFFIQLFFIYEVGKCPKHSGSESLPLLRHCRDPMEL